MAVLSEKRCDIMKKNIHEALSLTPSFSLDMYSRMKMILTLIVVISVDFLVSIVETSTIGERKLKHTETKILITCDPPFFPRTE